MRYFGKRTPQFIKPRLCVLSENMLMFPRMRQLLKTMQRYLVVLILLPILLAPVAGCSVFMAAQQPPAKNIQLFQTGTSRNALLKEFGPPYISEEVDGQKIEMFIFVQGYSKAVKAGRMIFHGAADIMTLGLWEIVGMPTEMIFNGEEMAFHVSYDEHDVVDEVNILKKK